MYQYNAEVLWWHDGDTVKLRIDLGFRVKIEEYVRLLGINTPELPTPEGLASLARASALAPVGAVVVISTQKNPAAKSFDRWLAAVTLSTGETVASILIREGLGVPYPAA